EPLDRHLLELLLEGGAARVERHRAVVGRRGRRVGLGRLRRLARRAVIRVLLLVATGQRDTRGQHPCRLVHARTVATRRDVSASPMWQDGDCRQLLGTTGRCRTSVALTMYTTSSARFLTWSPTRSRYRHTDVSGSTR